MERYGDLLRELRDPTKSLRHAIPEAWRDSCPSTTQRWRTVRSPPVSRRQWLSRSPSPSAATAASPTTPRLPHAQAQLPRR